VAVIEAMKMKTPMIATRSGTVTGIAVKVGDAVDAGQTLVVLG
ncbi:MAG: biotin/lipoyl-binding protein, partial [Rhodocyclaceae bacterium]|nr:biotin/lipoyl-binding protein [Rhodocyclaceae bacterium]